MKRSYLMMTVMFLSMSGLGIAAEAKEDKPASQVPAQSPAKSPGKAARAKRAAKKKQIYPAVLDGATVEVYKTFGDVKLNTYIFSPKGHKAGDKRPAIVFFFGGGWNAGSPKQFHEHCKYLASRGMVAMTADYRVASRHKVKVIDCVQDAKSAVRWIRQNAKRLGVDPNRVAAGGGSAGGHIAACTAMIQDFDEALDDALFSSVPDALVLFNPAMQLAVLDGKPPFDDFDSQAMEQRMGVKPARLSPTNNVRKGQPPSIMFFGTDDRLLAGAALAAKLGQAAGNRSELKTYKGHKHGFFNFGKNGNKPYKQTVYAADVFLASLGWLQGKPTIELPID
jgi:acetyl esterase